MLSLTTPAPDVTRVHLWSRVGRAIGYTVSAYVVQGVLVDTGFPGAGREVAALLDRMPIRGAIVTHAHEDHAGNAALVAARGVPILAGRETLARIRQRPSVPAYRRVVWGTPARLPDAVADFDDDRLQLIHAPGHSADHHVVWDAERGYLFGGDLFLGVKVRLAHAGEDPRTLVGTLRRLAALGPELLFDAHRGVVRDPVALLGAKADWIEETVAAIDHLTDEGMDEREIRRRVLGAESWMAHGSRGE
ncbi:MAG TPA: MBL fold metallo-hydrolase, partial [Gemmatimonadales bacterium]